jgi:4-hydroxybenzoate polyprenyltransferase
VGSIPSRLLVLIPLATLIAVGLHLANALPDIDADRGAGVRSLPVVVGVSAARWAGPAALAVVAFLALVLAVPVGQSLIVVAGGAVVLAAGVLVAVVRRSERPFPILAVATAVFAVAWLASLPT